MVQIAFLDYLNREDRGSSLLRNVGKYPLVDRRLYSKKYEFFFSSVAVRRCVLADFTFVSLSNIIKSLVSFVAYL